MRIAILGRTLIWGIMLCAFAEISRGLYAATQPFEVELDIQATTSDDAKYSRGMRS